MASYETLPPPRGTIPREWYEIGIAESNVDPRSGVAFARAMETALTDPFNQELRGDVNRFADWLRSRVQG